MAEQKNIHAGHRQRLFDRYAESGIEGFSDIELLELLLAYAIPRKDTNPIAHRLLDTFGTLSAVLEAPQLSLQKVEGMTQRAATLLRLLPQSWKRYEISRQSETKVFLTTEECGNYLVPFFCGLREERIRIMCLDAKCKLLDCREISRGSVNSAAMPIRNIVETALAVNATSVVIAHNHTSGIALPSGEDIDATRRLKEALAGVDILLVDHVIVADNDYVSLRDSAVFKNVFLAGTF